MTKRPPSVHTVVLAVGLLLMGLASALPAPGSARIEAKADRILREMSEYLKTAREFTFHAEVSYDSVLTSGEKIQYGGAADVSVRRPDRLHVEYSGDERQSLAIFDGRTFTVHDVAVNVYAATEVPAGIDAATDRMVEQYGVSVPVADLTYADPYATLTENVQAGSIVGRHSVDGTPCHHLAFSQDSIDWQIWIEDGPRPVPRKLLITYKEEPGSPQYTARLSGWDFQPRFSDHYFQFHPPEGADEVEFLPIPQGEAKQ
jgi:hypothetical protein